MNVVGALRQILLSNTAVQALVDDNVFPVVYPQGSVYPAIVVSINSVIPDNKKQQASDEDRVSVSVISLANNYDKAQKIHEAARRAIDNFSGTVTTTDTVNHYLKSVQFTNMSDSYDDENRLFYRTATYDVIYFRDPFLAVIGDPFESNAVVWFDSLPVYLSDEEALADGALPGSIYKTGVGHVSDPAGLPKQLPGGTSGLNVWFSSLKGFRDDQNAIDTGMTVGEIYRVNNSDNPSDPGGYPKQIT